MVISDCRDNQLEKSQFWTYSSKYVKFELDLSNYATKTDLKHATSVDTTEFQLI